MLLVLDAVFLVYVAVEFNTLSNNLGLLWTVAFVSIGAFIAVTGSNYLLSVKSSK
jgi:hypothetical protein